MRSINIFMQIVDTGDHDEAFSFGRFINCQLAKKTVLYITGQTNKRGANLVGGSNQASIRSTTLPEIKSSASYDQIENDEFTVSRGLMCQIKIKLCKFHVSFTESVQNASISYDDVSELPLSGAVEDESTTAKRRKRKKAE